MSFAIQGAMAQRIARELAAHPVVLYMNGSPAFPTCPGSATIVQILTQAGAPFHAVDVENDREIQSGLRDYAGWPGVPQLYVRGAFVGGADIVRALFSAGAMGAVLSGSTIP